MKKTYLIFPIILIILGLGVFGWIFVHGYFYAPDSEISLPAALKVATNTTTASAWNGSSTPDEYPVTLQIPSIGVNAKVQDVGITYKGNMGVPNNYTDVGWYKYGTVPGQIGSAVIDGHVDNGFSLPGVFKNLNEVKAGDDIYVTAANGTKLHFIVTDTTVVGYKDSTVDVFTRGGAPWLRLITCTGDWIPAAQTDDHRIIVTAKLAAS